MENFLLFRIISKYFFVKYLILIIYILSFGWIETIETSCICDHPSYTFLDDIASYKFVGRVKYLEQEKRDKTKWRGARFHKVLILEDIHELNLGDTISIVACNGWNCLGCLPSKIQANDELILKSDLAPRSEYEGNHIYSGDPISELVLKLRFCSENYLSIENNYAVGFFRSNKGYDKFRRNRWLNKVTFGLIKINDDLWPRDPKYHEKILEKSIIPRIKYLLSL